METKVIKKPIIIFYSIALGVAIILGILIALLPGQLGNPLAVLILAVLYMPIPTVATLITGKITTGRWSEYLYINHKSIKWKNLFLYPIAAGVLIYLLVLALTFVLGNVMHISAFGVLITTNKALLDELTATLGSSVAVTQLQQIPALSVLYPLALGSAITAGFTINGFFALGEEIGWRGFLVRQLKPLGNIKANVLTGILWGLWHAPLILMGYNYPGYPLLGILFMCFFTISLSFLLSWVQEKAHTTLASAVVHGTINGYGSFLVLIISGGIPLFGGITGLCAVTAVFIVYFIFKLVTPIKPEVVPA